MTGSFGDRIASGREDEWEPPTEERGSNSLGNLKEAINKLEGEWRGKGKQVSGRILLACHTLPYTCVFDSFDTSPDAHTPPPIEIRPGDLVVNPVALHSPVVEVKPLPAVNTDKTAFFHSQDLPPTPERSRSHSQDSHPERRSVSRWILRPRRGHAALNSGIRSLGDRDVTLVAWPGEMEDGNGDALSCDDLEPEHRDELKRGLQQLAQPGSGIKCVPVWMEEKLSSDFYEGYCKGYLWPLFHYFALSDHIDKEGERTSWDAYLEANRRYARALADQYQPGDQIWIHDYHLMLVPRLLRQSVPDALIGFFLHSPFPSSEFFRCLPRREAILDGMLGANLCCFQTYSYGRHFLSSCVRVMGYEGVKTGVDSRGHITHIGHCPIGIDADRIELDRSQPGVTPKIAALRELYKGKKIIIGRDKLDPTKGVLPKLQAFERFLVEYPEWVGRVVLIQVTSPSQHDSATLATKVSEIVDSINGTFGSLSYQPVHHYHQAIDRDEYFALLSVADLCLIHSIRDGMNTTSMEYVLCQGEYKNPLIVSEYCGTTSSMRSAIRINPWDLGDCARAINTCLKMDGNEKALRHSELYSRVKTHTAAVWARELSLKLLQCISFDPASESTPDLDTGLVTQRYQGAARRLMLFDYDGTLTPIVKTPSAATPSRLLLDSLTALTKDEHNIVYIISGRDSAFLQEQLGHIADLGFSAEHGCFLREPKAKAWEDLTKHMDMSWRQDVEDVFRYYEARTTGAFVEKKQSSVTFHYRNADPVYGEFQAKECQALLENMQQKLPIDVIVGKKNLEVRPAHTNKGEIVQRLLYQHPDAEFVICVGDDRTDEDMFRAVFEMRYAGEAGRSPTLTAPMSMLAVQAAHGSSPGTSPEVASHWPTSPPRRREQTPTPSNMQPAPDLPPIESKIDRDAVFAVVVDPNAQRKTIAQWRTDEPEDVIKLLSQLAGV